MKMILIITNRHGIYSTMRLDELENNFNDKLNLIEEKNAEFEIRKNKTDNIVIFLNQPQSTSSAPK